MDFVRLKLDNLIEIFRDDALGHGGTESHTNVPRNLLCVSLVVRLPGGEAAAAGAAHCPGNRSCADGAKEVSYLKTSCQDFLSSGLKYQHLSPPSPDLDHIAITVELRDQESGAPLEVRSQGPQDRIAQHTRDGFPTRGCFSWNDLSLHPFKTESLWLPVRIVGAAPNQPPRAAFMASFILEVDQFVLTPITTATLDAEDPEGPRDGLLFNVSVPPPRGYVTHLDEHTKPVGSFSWSDLHHLKVAYQPPNGSRSERDNFQVLVSSAVALLNADFGLDPSERSR